MRLINFISALLLCSIRRSESFGHSRLTYRSASVTMACKSEAGQQGIFRREIIKTAFLTSVGAILIPHHAQAATRAPLEDLLYKILRVREATQQEARLIKTGKFKDVQRANVKLAVKFMLENYRLADQFVQASTYIEDSSKRLEAAQVGQSAVQNLYTILEYFDSSDVENIKVKFDGLGDG